MNTLHGDSLEVLKTFESNTVDALITDPPAGISFMGKDWDHNKGGRDQWIAWMTSVMQECLRVMKPGAHGLVWALPRTSHWTATALENAGFEVRDVVTHLFGTGFPKSFNLGNGWGTALKPASEHWILVRKPCSEKTVAANVLKHGCGGLNIDGCRILPSQKDDYGRSACAADGTRYKSDFFSGLKDDDGQYANTQGRFPANLVLDEEAAEMLDEQSGCLGLSKGGSRGGKRNQAFGMKAVAEPQGFGDSGGASRFFYCAKASKSDRGEDNKHPTVKSTKLMQYLITLITPPNGIVLDPFMGSGSTGVAAKKLGFKFVGIEQNQEYFEIADRRISS